MPKKKGKKPIKPKSTTTLSDGGQNHDLVSVDGVLSDSAKPQAVGKKRNIGINSVITDIQSEEDAEEDLPKGHSHLIQFIKNKLQTSAPTSEEKEVEESTTEDTVVDDYAGDDEPVCEGEDDEGSRKCVYELLIVAFSIFVVVAGMSVFIILLALNHYSSTQVAVEPTVVSHQTITTSTSTTTSTTSTTTYTSTTTSTLHAIVCESPYIRFGLGCCLDVNENSVCDSDELGATTTTLNIILCFRDSDCGATRVEYICKDGDVYKITFTHFCKNPGSKASACERNIVEDLVDHCDSTQQCVSGRNQCEPNWAPNNFME